MELMEVYDFIVPMPPSVNAIWVRGKNSVYKSEKYTRWQAVAAKLIQEHPYSMIEGRYDLEITIPDFTRTDADNIIKAASDILEHCAVITNDRLMRNLTVQRGDIPAERCRISVTEI